MSGFATLHCNIASQSTSKKNSEDMVPKSDVVSIARIILLMRSQPYTCIWLLVPVSNWFILVNSPISGQAAITLSGSRRYPDTYLLSHQPPSPSTEHLCSTLIGTGRYKTFQVAPNSCFKQSKNRVRCDLRRLKNRHLMSGAIDIKCIITCLRRHKIKVTGPIYLEKKNSFYFSKF